MIRLTNLNAVRFISSSYKKKIYLAISQQQISLFCFKGYLFIRLVSFSQSYFFYISYIVKHSFSWFDSLDLVPLVYVCIYIYMSIYQNLTFYWLGQGHNLFHFALISSQDLVCNIQKQENVIMTYHGLIKFRKSPISPDA